MKVNIDQVKIRKRLRKDIGNLSQLKESMRRRGLINPITINRKFELLAGYRRLQAARELGWRDIEAMVVSARTRLEKFEIETDENIERKNFTSRGDDAHRRTPEGARGARVEKGMVYVKALLPVDRLAF